MWSKAVAAILVLLGAVIVIDASQGATDLQRASELLEPACGDVLVADGSLRMAVERGDEEGCYEALRGVADGFGINGSNFSDVMAQREPTVRSEQARLAVSAFEIDLNDHQLEVLEIELTDCSKSLIDVDIASASLDDPGIALWASACDREFGGKRHVRWVAPAATE